MMSDYTVTLPGTRGFLPPAWECPIHGEREQEQILQIWVAGEPRTVCGKCFLQVLDHLKLPHLERMR